MWMDWLVLVALLAELQQSLRGLGVVVELGEACAWVQFSCFAFGVKACLQCKMLRLSVATGACTVHSVLGARGGLYSILHDELARGSSSALRDALV